MFASDSIGQWCGFSAARQHAPNIFSHLSVAVATFVQRWGISRQWDTFSIPSCAANKENLLRKNLLDQIIRFPIIFLLHFFSDYQFFSNNFQAISSLFSLISHSICNSNSEFIYLYVFLSFRLNLMYWNWFVFFMQSRFLKRKRN